MNQFDVKLVKWGVIFFTDPATLKLDSIKLEISRRDGSTAFACEFSQLKRANLNTLNSMWTFVANDGQKCNVIIKNADAYARLKTSLGDARVKGFQI